MSKNRQNGYTSNSPTCDIAAKIIADMEKGKKKEPKEGTAAKAEAAQRDYDKYHDKVDHIAEDSRRGALMREAANQNKTRRYDGGIFVADATNVDSILDQFAAAVADRRGTSPTSTTTSKVSKQ